MYHVVFDPNDYEIICMDYENNLSTGWLHTDDLPFKRTRELRSDSTNIAKFIEILNDNYSYDELPVVQLEPVKDPLNFTFSLSDYPELLI